jgi:hypothetical protein
VLLQNNTDDPIEIETLDGAPYYSSQNDILTWTSEIVECDTYATQLTAFAIYEQIY